MGNKDCILEECRYRVFVSGMLSATLPVKDRAKLDMDFLETLVEIYPECE